MKSANSQLIKNLNQQIVLNLIRKYGPVSGADLAKRTKLQPATTSKILRALHEIGLIRDAGIGESTKQGGKRPNLWALEPEFGYIIGIEILPFEMRGVLLNFESRIVMQKTTTYELSINASNIVELVYELVRSLCQSSRVAMKKVIGVGLGVSGLVDAAEGIVRFSIGLGLENFPIRDNLKTKIRLNTIVDNDANMAAVGEKWIGSSVNDRHLVYITVNEAVTGIGCGVVLDGQLFRGVTHSAGEVTLALPALSDLYREAGEETDIPGKKMPDSVKLTMLSLINSAQNGDESARLTLVKLGKILAQEVARIIDFINPNSIVFGGDIVEAEHMILEPMREEVKKRALALPYEAVSIRMTSFGPYAVAIGAGAVVFKEIFKETASAVRHVFAVPKCNRVRTGA
ncbi:MAG: ROK family transcriptional regulator [Calditrichaeota bacterium]|nr:MAG: ROK family transcriptional regulator [Calditrichota bacterium]